MAGVGGGRPTGFPLSLQILLTLPGPRHSSHSGFLSLSPVHFGMRISVEMRDLVLERGLPFASCSPLQRAAVLRVGLGSFSSSTWFASVGVTKFGVSGPFWWLSWWER